MSPDRLDLSAAGLRALQVERLAAHGPVYECRFCGVLAQAPTAHNAVSTLPCPAPDWHEVTVAQGAAGGGA